jgi:Putative DNA-binding domain
MPISGTRLEALTEADLQGLVANQVREGRRIEYKEAVGGGNEARREFLGDVSSFANAAGGDLLIGVAERDGAASGLPGMAADAVDTEVLRLENLTRDGIDPRIPAIATRGVPVGDGTREVLVMRIPRSWATPHMVTYRGLSRFYSRNSAGKYPLDVTEIRAAFVASESARTQLRSFRIERLGRLAANEGPVRLHAPAKIVLHVLPLTALDPSTQYDVVDLANSNNEAFRPLYTTGWSKRINFDGVVAFTPPFLGEEASGGYTQVFRSGAIEGVEGYLLSRDNAIPSVAFEKTLIEGLGQFLRLLTEIGAPLPYVVGLALLGVRGYRMAVSESYIDRPQPIDRDDLVLPEVLVEALPTAPQTVLRLLFDAIWNASGWPRSPFYDDQGAWIGAGR